MSCFEWVMAGAAWCQKVPLSWGFACRAVMADPARNGPCQLMR